MAEERSTRSRPHSGNGSLSPEQRQSVVQALGRALSEQVQRRLDRHATGPVELQAKVLIDIIVGEHDPPEAPALQSP